MIFEIYQCRITQVVSVLGTSKCQLEYVLVDGPGKRHWRTRWSA